jgi:hypothetical protein
MLALCAGPVIAQGRPERGRDEAPREPRSSFGAANPSAAIAADMELARASREKGLYPALLARSAPEAVLFAPRLVWAQQWLKGRGGEAGESRETRAVWSSCDGRLVASRGVWRREGKAGLYTTVWQLQRDGAWRWVIDQASDAAKVPDAVDMISARVADCPDRQKRVESEFDGERHGRKPEPPKVKVVKPKDLPPIDPAHRAGASSDGSLRWDAAVGPDDVGRLTVTWRKDGADQVVALP